MIELREDPYLQQSKILGISFFYLLSTDVMTISNFPNHAIKQEAIL